MCGIWVENKILAPSNAYKTSYSFRYLIDCNCPDLESVNLNFGQHENKTQWDSSALVCLTENSL